MQLEGVGMSNWLSRKQRQLGVKWPCLVTNPDMAREGLSLPVSVLDVLVPGS